MPARSRQSRIVIIAAAVVALTLALGSASAPASGKWSSTKCNNTLTKWERQHQGSSSKKLNGYVKQLEKKHGCVFVG